MGFQPAEDVLVVTGLYLLGPETVVVVMSAKAGDTDTDGILSSADDAVGTLWVVLEAEHELCQHLRLYIRELVWPYLLDDITRGGGETTTLTYLECRLQRDGDGPTRGILAHIGLVYPRAGKVEARGYLRGGLLQVGAAAGCKSCGGYSLKHYILYSSLSAHSLFLWSATVLVDDKHIGLDDIQCWHEVHNTAAGIDIGILDITDALHHEEAFLFGIYGLAMLIAQIGAVAAYTHIQVTILSSLAEELHMTAVQKVVATGNENLRFSCLRV
jgi:hypothetical protein